MMISNAEITMVTILIVSIVTLVVILSFGKFGKTNGGKARKLPPGDMGWPIVGSTFSFFKPHSPTVLGDFIHRQITKHGKIFTAIILGKTTIISADPDLNRFVLQNEMRLFENNLPSQIRRLLGENNLPFVDEVQYKHTKSILLGFLKSWEIQTSFLEDVHKAANRILDAWKHKDVIYVSQETHKFAFDIVAEKAIEMDADDPTAEQLRREFVTLDEGLYSFPVNLPYTGYWKALTAKKNIAAIIIKRLESKKIAENKKTKPKDFVSWLLEYDNTRKSIEEICSATIGFIVAGLVNTTIAITLAIYFLGNCPKAVQQMRDEYQKVLRSKKDKTRFEWDDYKNMEFSQCVINETLRLGNVSPCLFKKAMDDTEFKGYLIPKGTPIITYAAALHLDPSAFERPENFNPWRWLSMKKPNSWMPFGAGMRYCSGSEIVRIKMVIFLHHLLLRYNWHPTEPDHPISLPPVVFPKEFPICVQALNIEHLS